MAIRTLQPDVILDTDRLEDIRLSDELVATYGLETWAARFSLMTAGYRDHVDTDGAASPKAPFNLVTVAIMAEARARVLRRNVPAGTPVHIHLGGEVRIFTPLFIQIAARIYAAHGFHVHLRRDVPTSPIWYSSFSVFYEEYQGGDNFTASHSPYFKQGWKVLDSEGKQLIEEEEAIIAEVRRLVAERAMIRLAPWSSDRIRRDLDTDAAYVAYQRALLGREVLDTICESRLRCAATTVGGSMGATSRKIFQGLGIPAGAISYFLDAEDSRFHRVGEIGDRNLGADVGNTEVCANTGAAAKLLRGEADLVLLWDPDGDRLNIMTTAPAAFRDRAAEFGLSLGPSGGERMVVYLTPNQLYLILLDYRIGLLRNNGSLREYDWFVGTSFPTAMAIEELARQEGLPTIRVPVGFRNIGELCRTLEANLGAPQEFTTLTGKRIPLGPAPRPVLLCEESGGATLGGAELLRSRTGRRAMLALREKDGMHLSLLAWAATASAHLAGASMAERYCDIISQRNIRFRHSARFDVALYDETLTGDALREAREHGIEKRDRAVAFFREAATASARNGAGMEEKLREANPTAAAGALSQIRQAAWIGDGSLFEMDDARLIVRASGTDALMRYYVETTSPERLDALHRFVAGLEV